MSELCKGCKWNNYPYCNGSKDFDGNFMRIDNLRPIFMCGQKDNNIVYDFSIIEKTKLELLEERIEILENANKTQQMFKQNIIMYKKLEEKI